MNNSSAVCVIMCPHKHLYFCLDIVSTRLQVRKYSSEDHSSVGLLRKAWNWINYDYSAEVCILLHAVHATCQGLHAYVYF